MKESEIIKNHLDKLGLNERTEFIDVEKKKKKNKRSFRLRRVSILDDKRKYPNRKYYSDDVNDEIYFFENENLFQQYFDDNFKERGLTILRPKLTYGKY